MDERNDERREIEAALSLNDALSLDRTRLANQRTLLAYVRTFLGLVTAGVAMIQILTQFWVHLVGYLFLVLGPVLLVIGLVQFFWLRRRINRLGYRD